MAIPRVGINLRITHQLAESIRVSVAETKAVDPKFSINDFITHAVTEKLNRGTLPAKQGIILDGTVREVRQSDRQRIVDLNDPNMIVSPEVMKATSGIPGLFPMAGTFTEFVLASDLKDVDGDLVAEVQSVNRAIDSVEYPSLPLVKWPSREEFDRRYPLAELPEWPATANLDHEKEAPQQSWASQFAAWKAAGEYGAQLMADATEHIKLPKGFREMPERKQIEWLDSKHPLGGK